MPAKSDKLTAASAPAAVGGAWAGNAYERTNKAVSNTPASDDMVIIYNDKGPNQNVLYSTHYNVPANRTAVGSDDFTIGTGVLSFTNLGTASDLLNLSGLGSTTNFDNDASTTDVPGSFQGSFHGLAGTFTCTNACTIQELKVGGYVTTGTWTFTPKGYVQASSPTVSIPDPDFMHFGYWTNMRDGSKGEPIYAVEAFYGGTSASNASTVQGLNNLSATYEGEASGLYVKETFAPDGTATPTASGQFTADASLKAVFGDPSSVASTHHNRVSGTITNFMADGSAIDSKWSVDLMVGSFASGDNSAASPFTGRTRPTGSTVAAAGQGAWEYRFFGAMVDDPATTTVTETGVPTGIAGEFDGHFTNGQVMGAFGATSTGVKGETD